MIRLTEKIMKIHHASSKLPIKNKLFTDEKDHFIPYSLCNHIFKL
jgi:hypothetical protein